MKHGRYFVSALPCRWISKFRQRSAAYSCTYTYGNAHASRNRSRRLRQRLHQRHSAPRRLACAFCTDAPTRVGLRSQIFSQLLPLSMLAGASFENFAESRKSKARRGEYQDGLMLV